MERRKFLKTMGAGVTAAGFGATAGMIPFSEVLAAAPENTSQAYDMVAVMNGEPVEMFERAMAAMGGMGKFVRSGQSVVVKPNIGWDASPERGANTNPELVAKIIEHCFKAGAKEVSVFDRTCDQWRRCYENSGIEKAARDAGAKVVSGDAENLFRTVSIPGKRMKSAKVHELVLNSDVFINVPILKHHGGAGISIAMKNMMGVVWDRGFWHQNDLQQCIADFLTFKKPDLNIIDAYRVMKRNGPKGVSVNDVSLAKSLIISTDIVAADAAASAVFGKKASEVAHIRNAAEMGLGKMDLSQLNIHRINLG